MTAANVTITAAAGHIRPALTDPNSIIMDDTIGMSMFIQLTPAIAQQWLPIIQNIADKEHNA